MCPNGFVLIQSIIALLSTNLLTFSTCALICTIVIVKVYSGQCLWVTGTRLIIQWFSKNWFIPWQKPWNIRYWLLYWHISLLMSQMNVTSMLHLTFWIGLRITGHVFSQFCAINIILQLKGSSNNTKYTKTMETFK